MAFLDRLFGFSLDAVAGGTDYDGLTLGAVPDATIFYPITGGSFDGGIERIDRNDEVRGRRANVPPRSFRAAPAMTIPLSAYRKAIEKLAYLAMGDVNTTGGGGATPYTHTITTIGYPDVSLPAINMQMVRDTVNIKMAGSTLNRITLDFPLDGEGTIEFEAFGKFHDEFTAASPTPSFTGFGAEVDTLMLRDARFYIDGSVTQVQDLQGFNFAFVNNLIRKWYAGRNISSKTLGTVGSFGTQRRKLWFPAENKAQAAPDITYSVTFGNTNAAQEVAMWYAQIQKFEFDIVGLPLTGAYSATDEKVTIIIYNSVNTGGGSGALTAREDITSSFDGGVFFSEADSKDIEIVVTSDTADLTA